MSSIETYDTWRGPWRACPTPNDRLNRWFVIIDGVGAQPVVCEKIRTEGNARMLASAPEALGVLRQLVVEDPAHPLADEARGILKRASVAS